MVDIDYSITIQTAEDMAERLEKELIGAWRAGYDYLYVAPDIGPMEHNNRTATTLTVQYRVLPSNHELEHNPLDVSMTRYDLTELTVEEYQRVKNGL